MIEAGQMKPTDLVFLDNSVYGFGERLAGGDVIVVHECPDGQIRSRRFDPWDELETAGERLAALRGRLVVAQEKASRQYGNPVRKEHARQEVAELQAQIDALEALDVVAEVILGSAERCHDCGGSGCEGSDVCPACWGSGQA